MSPPLPSWSRWASPPVGRRSTSRPTRRTWVISQSPGITTASFSAKITSDATLGEYTLPLTIQYQYLSNSLANQPTSDTLQYRYTPVTVTIPLTIKIEPVVQIDVLRCRCVGPGRGNGRLRQPDDQKYRLRGRDAGDCHDPAERQQRDHPDRRAASISGISRGTGLSPACTRSPSPAMRSSRLTRSMWR